MNIGFIGLGKLGLPMALAIESKGHRVIGTDTSESVKQIVSHRKIPYLEAGVQEALSKSQLFFTSIDRVVAECELSFLAVQTPHKPEFEGITPLTDTRSDFDYHYLREAVRGVCEALVKQRGTPRTLVIVSTVLPGTVRREIFPIIANFGCTHNLRVAYNPSFIAMGTAMQDFLDPEFVLIGGDSESAKHALSDFYRSIHIDPPKTHYLTTIENAELIKVLYNTYIGLKLMFANTVMEICHKSPGTDVDAVTTAFRLATKRLISPAYLSGGMGDAGGCHPRDNIALSWLARKLNLSSDIFGNMMHARDAQTRWLANLVTLWHQKRQLPIVLLGAAYKAESNIVTGSCALLLQRFLAERGFKSSIVDPHVGPPNLSVLPVEPSVFFVSTKHNAWKDASFPHGSVVIDPWRYLRPRNEVTYIPVGIGTPE